MQRAAVLFQGRQVTVWVIGLAILPAGVIDSSEFKSQGTAGLVVFVIVTLFVFVIIALGPRLLLDRTASVFVEGLSAKFGTTVAHVDGFGVAALDDHRCHAIELGHFGGVCKAVPIGAKSDQQAWTQRRACPRQAAKNGGVGGLIHG